MWRSTNCLFAKFIVIPCSFAWAFAETRNANGFCHLYRGRLRGAFGYPWLTPDSLQPSGGCQKVLINIGLFVLRLVACALPQPGSPPLPAYPWPGFTISNAGQDPTRYKKNSWFFDRLSSAMEGFDRFRGHPANHTDAFWLLCDRLGFIRHQKHNIYEHGLWFKVPDFGLLYEVPPRK